MAAPVRASTTITTGSANGSATGNLPATVNSGDRLIALVVIDSAGASPIVGPGGSWTERLGTTIFTGTTGSTGYAFALYELIADGTEDGGTVAFTHSGLTEDFLIIVTRHTGAHASQALEVGSVGEDNTDSTPDPASLTASWGAEDNSFISFAVSDRINTGQTPAAPTGYTFNTTKGTDWDASALDNSGAAIGFVADKGVTATATDDPAAWDLKNLSAPLSSAFVAVLRPAAASTTIGPLAGEGGLAGGDAGLAGGSGRLA